MWNETPSEHFVARHEDRDASDAEGVLELLEATRARLARAFAVVPAGVDVILHGSDAQLLLARPGLLATRALAAPAARRYVTGTWGRRELHVLAPRRLEERASAVPGSRELVLLSPAGLYCRLVVGSSSRALGSPRRARRLARPGRGGGGGVSGPRRAARPPARTPARLAGLGGGRVVLGPDRARASGDHAPPARGPAALVPARPPRRAADRRHARRPPRARARRGRGRAPRRRGRAAPRVPGRSAGRDRGPP